MRFLNSKHKNVPPYGMKQQKLFLINSVEILSLSIYDDHNVFFLSFLNSRRLHVWILIIVAFYGDVPHRIVSNFSCG
jgi:hypothetical protein